MRRQRRLARRRELHAARMNSPRRRIVIAKIDRRHPDDSAVLDIDENRPAIGHVAIAHAAVGKARADRQPHRLAHHDGLREPVGEILGALDGELEILLRIDLVEPVDRRHEQADAQRSVLERQGHVGISAQPRSRRDASVTDRVPAADFLVARLDLRYEIALLEPRPECRVAPGGIFEKLRQAEQDERELHRRKHDFLLIGPPRAGFLRPGAIGAPALS